MTISDTITIGSYQLFYWSTDTSDLRHFGPKTFRHHVFGAEVEPKCPEMSQTLWH